MIGSIASATTAVMLVSAPYHTHDAATRSGCTFIELDAYRENEPALKLGSAGHAWADQQINRLSRLKANWDGYGADPVSVKRLGILAKLLRDHLPPGTPHGSIVPGADGSVQAEWHLRDHSFGLLIDADDSISAWFQSIDGDAEIEERGMRGLELLKVVAINSLA